MGSLGVKDLNCEDWTRASLLLRVRNTADESAWREFVQRYTPMILAWAKRQGLRNGDADEATSRVMMKLVGHLPRFDYDPKRGKFRSYLYKVTANAVNDLFRELRKQPFTTEDTHGHVLLSCLSDPSAEVDLLKTLEKENELDTLREAIRRAETRCEKPHVWQSYYLTQIKGLTAACVAQQLNLKVAQVYVYRGRVKGLIEEERTRLIDETERES